MQLQIIPSPKKRSSKWVSSSVPENSKQPASAVHYSSAEYHINNFRSPVLFYEALQVKYNKLWFYIWMYINFGMEGHNALLFASSMYQRMQSVWR